jgi:hypothetical protein
VTRAPPEDFVREKWHNGCPGLEKVFIVVRSVLHEVPQGQMHAGTSFRPATTNGLSSHEQEWRNFLESSIRDVKRGSNIMYPGYNRWVGDNIPEFHFVSFAPHALSDGTIFDAIAVDLVASKYLFQEEWVFLKNEANIHGVTITVTELNKAPDLDQREIGIMGPKKGVKLAKMATQNKVKGMAILS